MLDKYRRPDFRDYATTFREVQGSEFTREVRGSSAAGINPKRKFLMVYVGLALIALILILLQVGDRNLKYLGQPYRQGVATVVDKHTEPRRSGELRYMLSLSIPITSGFEARTDVRVDLGGWSEIHVNDRLDVAFQVDRRGRNVRVTEISLSAPVASTPTLQAYR